MKESSEQQFSGLGADVVANWRLVEGRKALASEKDSSSLSDQELHSVLNQRLWST